MNLCFTSYVFLAHATGVHCALGKGSALLCHHSSCLVSYSSGWSLMDMGGERDPILQLLHCSGSRVKYRQETPSATTETACCRRGPASVEPGQSRFPDQVLGVKGCSLCTGSWTTNLDLCGCPTLE